MRQDEMFEDLAERIKQMQIKARVPCQGERSASNLSSQVRTSQRLTVGLFQPGASYDSLVRFSDARGEVLGDLRHR